jgi:hypothetical protein
MPHIVMLYAANMGSAAVRQERRAIGDLQSLWPIASKKCQTATLSRLP